MIRKAQKEDINEIIELLKYVNQIHYELRPDLFRLNSKYNYEELLNLLNNPSYLIYVYEEDIIKGYIIGIIKETKTTNLFLEHKSLYIDDLCVKKMEQNKGIGTLLINYMIEKGKELAVDDITLNVYQENINAYNFYLNQGFKVRKIILEKDLKEK